MYKKIMNILFCLVVILFVNCIYPLNTFATSESKVLKTKTNVPCDKIWTISFNKSINSQNIEDNIEVVDNEGRNIEIEFKISNDKKTIKVSSVENYEPGMRYTLKVNNKIKHFNEEENLCNSIKMDFVISEEAQNVIPVNSYDDLKKLLNTNKSLYGIEEDGLLENSNYQDKNSELDTLVPTLNYITFDKGIHNKDKADSIICDGEYIYRINKSNVEVVKAYPYNEMMIVNIINFDNEDYSPSEIYIEDDKLYVIGNYRTFISDASSLDEKEYDNDENDNKEQTDNEEQYENNEDEVDSLLEQDMKIYSPGFDKNVVKVMVFDISDKESINQIRSFEVDGNYIASRIVNSRLHVITNKSLNHYFIEKNLNLLPQYKDSIIDNNFNEVNLNNIYYIPNFQTTNYLTFSSIELNETNSEVNIDSFLGAGYNVYVSDNNVYSIVSNEEKTCIYKFGLSSEGVQFKAMSQISGKVINQFSMNEYNSNFRIASVVKNSNDKLISNNLYVMDENLKIISSLENIAEGDVVKTVKFMNDNAYFITFREDNPVYVVNLSEIDNLLNVGYMNIPVFSNWIYQYDDNHLIGIGYEKEDIFDISETGQFEELGPVQDGMKISIYNIEDDNIFEEFSYKIGDSGTYSEVLNNNGAMFISPKDNQLIIPVSVFEREKNGKSEFAFQGVYVFNIDLQNGIKLEGEISNIDKDNIESVNYNNVNNENIQKMFHINNIFYTVSNDKVTAYDINNLEEKMHINIDKYINIRDYLEFKKNCDRLNDVFICKTNNLMENKDYFIELTENQTNGYVWKMAIENQDIIAVTNDKVFDLKDGLLNEGYVNHVWKLKPLQKGETKIILEYYNSGDEENPKTKTIEFNILVD
jgi:inhibitor of cysteine peptidase